MEIPTERVVEVAKLARQGGVAFWLAGKPVARPSGHAVKARYEQGGRSMKLTELYAWYRQIQWAAAAAVNEARQSWTIRIPMTEPVVVAVTVYRTVPAERKPDLSNYVKGVEDALTGVLYEDDSQVIAYGAGTMKVQGLIEGISVVVVPERTVINARVFGEVKALPLSIEGRELRGTRA